MFTMLYIIYSMLCIQTRSWVLLITYTLYLITIPTISFQCKFLLFQPILLRGLSTYKEAVVVYIAGFVVRSIQKKIDCETCLGALICSREEAEKNLSFSLLNRKRWGKLIDSSSDVINICIETEKTFCQLEKTTNGFMTKKRSISPLIVSTVLKSVCSKSNQIFQNLSSHMTDCLPDNNHVFILVKLIAKCYCNIRLHHIAKQITSKITESNVRKNLTKLILFKNQ